MGSISTSSSSTCSMEYTGIYDNFIPCGLEMFTSGDSLDLHDDTSLKMDMLNLGVETPAINPQTSYRLLLLPGELRNSIYTHLSSTSSNASSPLVLSHDKLDGILPLLLVNKQLRSEVCTFLLRGRTIIFDIHPKYPHLSCPLGTITGVKEVESLFNKFGHSNFPLITRFRFRAMDEGAPYHKKKHESWYQGLDVTIVPRGDSYNYEVKAFRHWVRGDSTDTSELWTPIQLARLIEAKKRWFTGPHIKPCRWLCHYSLSAVAYLEQLGRGRRQLAKSDVLNLIRLMETRWYQNDGLDLFRKGTIKKLLEDGD